MAKKDSVRRHEYVDPNPLVEAVRFQRPPTIAEQIARFMGQHERFQAEQGHELPEEADDFGDDDEDEPRSPHELVFDPLLNREIPLYEKALLERDRVEYDRAIAKKIADDRKAHAIAAKAKADYIAERKNSKKTKSAAADEDET